MVFMKGVHGRRPNFRLLRERLGLGKKREFGVLEFAQAGMIARMYESV